MPEAEPKPKVKLTEASVQLLKATATFVGADGLTKFTHDGVSSGRSVAKMNAN